MNITDVNVVISVSGQSGQAGTWFPLIYVAGEGEATYKEYSSLADVAVDHNQNTDVYKAANLLFMQGDAYIPNKIAICSGGTNAMTALAPYMDKDWRQLIIVGGEYDNDVATAIETTEKMYFTHFKTQTAATTAKITDLDRTVAVVYTGVDVANPEAAIVGRMAGLVAGEGTYHAKVVKGVTPDAPAAYRVTVRRQSAAAMTAMARTCRRLGLCSAVCVCASSRIRSAFADAVSCAVACRIISDNFMVNLLSNDSGSL